MSFLTILLIAVGMAMDATAVSLCVGANHQANSTRSRLRLAFHFGIFQAFMPVVGWYLGASVEHWVSAIDHWVAAGLLVYLGIKMIRSGWQSQTERCEDDPTRGKTLLMLSIATSIDALAVGFSMAILRVPVVMPALVIGLVTFSFSMLGLLTGSRLSARFGNRMEIMGGVILIFIGLRILATHLQIFNLISNSFR